MSEAIAMKIEFGLVVGVLLLVTLASALRLPLFFSDPTPVEEVGK